MQIGGEHIENLLMNKVLKKRGEKKTSIKRHLSMGMG
jgi:hypothetical protein